jgi:hypothetical protein
MRSEDEIAASGRELEPGVPEGGLADPDPAFDDAGPRPAFSGPQEQTGDDGDLGISANKVGPHPAGD